VELHELHVGERGAGPIRDRHAVAGRDVGVAGVEVDLPGSAGGEQRDAGLEADHRATARVEHVGAQRAIRPRQARPPTGEQVHPAVVLEQADVGVGARSPEQHALDLAPRGVAAVEDAPVRVAALAAEIEGSPAPRGVVPGRIEVRPELEQGLDHLRAPLDHVLDYVRVAESRPGFERVPRVGLEGIVVGLHGGDPALRPVGGGVRRPLLGHDRDRAAIGHAQGIEEPCDAAAQDQDVEAERIRHCGIPGSGAG
jgi:hypothetical protein